MKGIMAVAGYFLLHILVNLAVVAGGMAYFYFANRGLSSTEFYEGVLVFTAENNNLLLAVTNAVILLVVFIISRKNKTGFFAFCGLNQKLSAKGTGFMCILAGAAANFWFSFMLNSNFMPHDLIESYAESYSLVSGGPLAIKILSMVVLAPIAEEILFRGLIYGRLGAIMPSGAAIFVQGLMFGFLHGDPVWIVYAAILGFIMGYIRHKSGSLRASVLFHISFNAASYAFDAYADAFWEVQWALIAALIISAVALLFSVDRIRASKG